MKLVVDTIDLSILDSESEIIIQIVTSRFINELYDSHTIALSIFWIIVIINSDLSLISDFKIDIIFNCLEERTKEFCQC